jgi:hypothetical protein
MTHSAILTEARLAGSCNNRGCRYIQVPQSACKRFSSRVAFTARSTMCKTKQLNRSKKKEEKGDGEQKQEEEVDHITH